MSWFKHRLTDVFDKRNTISSKVDCGWWSVNFAKSFKEQDSDSVQERLPHVMRKYYTVDVLVVKKAFVFLRM